LLRIAAIFVPEIDCILLLSQTATETSPINKRFSSAVVFPPDRLRTNSASVAQFDSMPFCSPRGDEIAGKN
jgi:hypothetical protein